MGYLDEYEDIIDSIDRGDINEEWLYHDDEYVRYALAEIDYRPDILINDDEELVTSKVLSFHPELIHHLLGKPKQVQAVSFCIFNRNDIPVETLKRHVEGIKKYDSELRYPILETKIAALEYEPTLIELTMSPKELYDAGSPLWAKTLTPMEIIKVEDGEGIW